MPETGSGKGIELIGAEEVYPVGGMEERAEEIGSVESTDTAEEVEEEISS